MTDQKKTVTDELRLALEALEANDIESAKSAIESALNLIQIARCAAQIGLDQF